MPGVGIGILIFNENGEVLCILRIDDAKKADSAMHLEGTWTLPAGKVKYGETIFEAAKRKVKEEVDLDIDNLEIVSIADDINEFAHFVTIGVVAKMVKGTISLGDSEEHVRYQYFSFNKLPDNLCEPSKKIIEHYIKHKIYE